MCIETRKASSGHHRYTLEITAITLCNERRRWPWSGLLYYIRAKSRYRSDIVAFRMIDWNWRGILIWLPFQLPPLDELINRAAVIASTRIKWMCTYPIVWLHQNRNWICVYVKGIAKYIVCAVWKNKWPLKDIPLLGLDYALLGRSEPGNHWQSRQSPHGYSNWINLITATSFQGGVAKSFSRCVLLCFVVHQIRSIRKFAKCHHRWCFAKTAIHDGLCTYVHTSVVWTRWD